MVTFLVERGADCDAETLVCAFSVDILSFHEMWQNGWWPISKICQYGGYYQQLLRKFIEHGARVNVADSEVKFLLVCTSFWT